MQIKIIKPGLQTTIQDSGRFGWMHYGFSRAGAMDPLSANLANQAVNRLPNHPILEFTLVGPDIVFEGDFQIAITGAESEYRLNEQPVPQYTTISVQSGDCLSFVKMTAGCRGYIAFREEMNIPNYLGSVATHPGAQIGGLNGCMLQAGDTLNFLKAERTPDIYIPDDKQPRFSGNYRIRIIEAPETLQFPEVDGLALVSAHFQVTPDSNRMGIRLDSDFQCEYRNNEFRSRGLIPGAIQVPPDGKPIIAGVDAQTIGGYPRIAQVIQADLPVIGQLRPHDNLQFQWLSREQATEIYQAQLGQLSI